MPWREVSIMQQRREFVELAGQEDVNRRELCRRFGVHPSTGYKWLDRWRSGGELGDRSRRPHASPARTAAAIEACILALRDAHPAWGARKIAHCLERDGLTAPALSTVHAILRRHEPDRGAARRCAGLTALRDGGAQSALADGLQGRCRA
jgi:transposase-like protein